MVIRCSVENPQMVLIGTLYPRGGKQTLDIKVTMSDTGQKWSACLAGDYIDTISWEGGSRYLESREALGIGLIFEDREFWANSEDLALHCWGVRNPEDRYNALRTLSSLQEEAELLFEEYLENWAKGPGMLENWCSYKHLDGKRYISIDYTT